MPMKARFIEPTGERRDTLSRWWGESKSCCGKSQHFATRPYRTVPNDHPKLDWDEVPVEEWPTKCRDCGAEWEPGTKFSRSSGPKTVYNTDSGSPEPGDLYFVDVKHGDDHCVWHAEGTCDGEHLMARVPTGEHWDIDGRASNCTLKDDKVHRCWVRTGDPRKGEPVTAGKMGPGVKTCSAGAGSIATAKYHGFLRDGVWT
jgi:hypothetical protein